MNKSVFAGAAAVLLAGVAITAPMLARSADTQPAAGQSTPIIPPMGQAAQRAGNPDQGMPGHGMMGGAAGMMDHPGMEGMGPMAGGRHDGMREIMARRMMMRRLPPQQRCEEHLARRAAMIAYTVTKLNLTAEQRPLWDKLNAVIQAGTERQQQLCAALKQQPQAGQRTVLDRVAWMDQMLSTAAQSLHEARPALEQLYQKLTPEQKAIIDQPPRHGRP